jgi:hypothetical protein
MRANPEAFAKGLEGVRNIAARKAIQQYEGAYQIHKDFPQNYPKSALPTLPKYMQDIRESLKPQIIEKSQLPKAQPVTTRGGVQFQRR